MEMLDVLTIFTIMLMVMAFLVTCIAFRMYCHDEFGAEIHTNRHLPNNQVPDEPADSPPTYEQTMGI